MSDKVRINIVTLGHSNHGKSTLSQALLSVLVKRLTISAPLSFVSDANPNVFFSEYETPDRHYTLMDCAEHSDYGRVLITGAFLANATILVIDVTQGLTDEAREQVAIAAQIGIDQLFVFINKCDLADNQELVDTLVQNSLQLLSEHNFAGETPIITGSALAAQQGNTAWEDKVLELANQLDTSLPNPISALNKPFLFEIESTTSLAGRGTEAIGRVVWGMVTTGVNVTVVGFGPSLSATVIGIEGTPKVADQASAGEKVGLVLGNVPRTSINPGQVLTRGDIYAYEWFECWIYLSQGEGGSQAAIFNNKSFQFYMHNASIAGTINLLTENEFYPGNYTKMRIQLANLVALYKGFRFSVQDSKGRRIGTGVVSTLL